MSAQQRNIYAREWLSVYLYQENRYGKYNKSLGMGRGLQKTTNLQEQYSARRASHFCFFFFFWEFSFILNNDSTNPFFSSRATRQPIPIPSNPSFVSSIYFGVLNRKILIGTRHNNIILVCRSIPIIG